MKEDDIKYCTKHHTSYVTECHSCYREKTECIHGVPFDDECGECIEDKQIIDAGRLRAFSIRQSGKELFRYFQPKREEDKKPFTFEEVSCKEKLDNSLNNGGKTDYYQLDSAPFPIKDFDDFAEWRGMNGNQFNMGKVMWTFNVGRHNGTNYERDLNKIIHYAQRELLRIKR